MKRLRDIFINSYSLNLLMNIFALIAGIILIIFGLINIIYTRIFSRFWGGRYRAWYIKNEPTLQSTYGEKAKIITRVTGIIILAIGVLITFSVLFYS